MPRSASDTAHDSGAASDTCRHSLVRGRLHGHANIKTTSTYLAGTTDGLEEYFARFERKRGAREKPAEKDAQEDAHVATEQPATPTNAQIS